MKKTSKLFLGKLMKRKAPGPVFGANHTGTVASLAPRCTWWTKDNADDLPRLDVVDDGKNHFLPQQVASRAVLDVPRTALHALPKHSFAHGVTARKEIGHIKGRHRVISRTTGCGRPQKASSK